MYRHAFKYYSIIFLLIFVTNVSKSQSLNLKFENISNQQGLSQNAVYSITQDKKGFLWIATQDGLNRYDGYNFLIFKSDFTITNSISNNDLRCIFQDQEGIFWIGTWGGGLNQYNETTKKIVRFKNDAANSKSISSNFISSICEDKFGNLWIGTEDGILNQFIKKTNTFERYIVDSVIENNSINSLFVDKFGVLWIGSKAGLAAFNVKKKSFIASFKHSKTNDFSISDNFVTSIFEDNQGILWVGTRNGLNIFDKIAKHFYRFYHSEKENTISSNNITCIFQGKSNTLWIGTDDGLNLYDRQNKNFISYYHDPTNVNTISSNNILSIYEDNFGILWVGTYGRGVDKANFEKKKFVHYKRSTNQQNTLSNEIIFAITQDENENIWIGTFGGGINILNRETHQYSFLRHDPLNQNSLSNNYVRALLIDASGFVWIGTSGGGLDKYDPVKKQFTHFKHHPTNPNSISSNYIYSIYQDCAGIIWIGTQGGGVCFFDEKKQTFKTFRNVPSDNNSLSHNDVFYIREDPNGNYWICTRNGLNKFDYEKQKITRYLSNPEDPKSLSHPKVYNVLCEVTGTIWVGTGNGLNKLNPRSNKIEKFTEKDGLPNSVIYSMVFDKRGNIWLTTNKGLSIFNPQTKKFKNYTQQDGLQSDEFDVNTCFANENGELFFGGINGFNSFFPDSIKDNPHIPPIVVTNLKIFNTIVEPGPKSQIQVSITECKEIEFTHHDNSFSLEFAALHFVSPDKNKYAFKLEGFDPDWNYTDAKMRFAVYTNLDPGDYIFKVKGSNCDAVWNNKGVSIKITVLPPFWETWWFKSLLYITIAGAVAAWYVMRMARLQKQKQELERLVKLRTAEIEKQKSAIENINLELQQQKEEIQLQAEVLERTNKELEKLSIVASETDNAILIMDAEGNFEWVNQAYTRMFGYTFEELTSKISANIIGANTSPEIKAKIKQCIDNHETVQYEMMSLNKNGKKLWTQITLTPILDDFGKISKLIAIDSDISKLKEAEAEILLQKEEIQSQADNLEVTNRKLEKLSIVARETDNAVVIMDALGNLEWVNEGFTRLFGYNLDEFKNNCGSNLIEVSSNPTVAEAINHCLTDKKTIIYEAIAPTKSGQKIWVQTTLTPIIDDKGNIKKLIAIDSDITKLKDAENEIRLQSEELLAQRDELEAQKNQIEEKNKLIKGSLNYALSIQKALLPAKETLNFYFDSFIIYKPKDIVSGDFYWFSQICNENKKNKVNTENPSINTSNSKYQVKLFLAVVDCTGHGVPGAFMSMIGMRLLSEIVNEKGIYSPSAILTLLNESIIKALRQEETNNSDGMDVCLCTFDGYYPDEYKKSDKPKITKAVFTGAKRPLFVCKQNDGTEIVTVKGSRKTIGGTSFSRSDNDFTETVIDLETNDILYLSTDGIIDQNSNDRKRFGTLKFLNILNQHISKPLEIQKTELEKALYEFQQNEEQRDDITVIGIKIR